MKNTEEWRQHPLGIWISDKGRVITKINGVHYGSNQKKGYKAVNWNGKKYSVHRLVAECFLNNPNNLPLVNHKDENKANNCIENLEWCDNKYNLNYGNAQVKKVAKIDYKAIAKKLSIPILQFDKQGKFIKEWESAHQVEREMGYAYQNITACCKGRSKSANGYIWKYKDIA